MYPSRYTDVTEVTPDVVQQTLEFAGYQWGLATRMGLQRMTGAERAMLATLAEHMYTALDDARALSDSRWAVFSFASARSGNEQHHALIADWGMALLRNLRGWTVAVDDRERMLQVYRDFHDAVVDGDPDEAERLTRAMYYV